MNPETAVLALAIAVVAGLGLVPLLAVVRHNRRVRRIEKRLREADIGCSSR
jgi:formate-dependent nitrite reductase membrane component NrfD